MKIKELINRYKTDHEWQSIVSATISFVMSGFFLVYNLVLGIIHNLIWHYSISVYYLLLMVLRAIVVFKEKKWKNLPLEQLESNRITLFKMESYCFILIDLAMIVPIIMMIFAQRQVHIGMIPAIAMATYTTYTVTMAIIGFKKARGKGNWSIIALKIISLKSAIVSILTLQNTLIMVFSEDANSLLPLTSVTSGVMFLGMITISVLALRKAIKQCK